ncbi:hypothetical protein [Methylobacterium sp. SD21]|uniref:hypothetical protein n=1 Tax=Methylobacterium litchii TaxID=3138810 RepID=UPI00313E2B3E
MTARRSRAEVAALREAILDRWATGARTVVIAAELGITGSLVDYMVRQAREAGDARAAFRYDCAASREAAPSTRRGRRNAILNAWAAGKEAPQIASVLGMRWRTVTMVVIRARKAGDPRATRRHHDPADGMAPSVRAALERAARRYGVTVTVPGEHP